MQNVDADVLNELYLDVDSHNFIYWYRNPLKLIDNNPERYTIYV